MSLGTKLRELRHEKKLSQTQVAVELDVSQTAYGKWESDQTKPGIDNLLKISEFYGTDIYDLLDNKERNNNFINSYDNSNVNNEISTVNYYVSDKLVEQYEARLREKDEQIALLKSLLEKK
ncbi:MULTISPECIES: helix-turn-helix domain-containing protein [Chryseobacterium]|uniref:Predicted transcriptional regulator n=1 Tax=Chryseobacterium taihuense TaxID=1141221 RepID=A0A4U8WDG1_9FLAO|nr:MULTISPECIES: helix-turn-helix domain-containing protein [Chryseobacterium]QQV02323.1 helix-turn-helix transcriptional regulator [Chryseobacterium sp. FDAARGOS 1104]VFB04431.1 Predicted transcriptional regulator [Chryseobacterium taihuense]